MSVTDVQQFKTKHSPCYYVLHVFIPQCDPGLSTYWPTRNSATCVRHKTFNYFQIEVFVDVSEINSIHGGLQRFNLNVKSLRQRALNIPKSASMKMGAAPVTCAIASRSR